MRTAALIGLISICMIVLPAGVYAVLRWKAGLVTLPVRWWLVLYVVAFFFQPIFLVRKQLEGALVRNDPSWPMAVLAQIDNAWWEELAKLLALSLVLWLARKRIRPLLQKLSWAMGLGYWVGLAYGAGEAVVLAILFIAPNLDPIFGVNTFTPVPLSWGYVYERFWAMQIHAVMGALIGAGLWNWVNGKRLRLAIWFVVAMLYHHLVDGSIILAGYVPAVGVAIRTLGLGYVPLLTAIGYGLIVLVYLILRRSRWTLDVSPV